MNLLAPLLSAALSVQAAGAASLLEQPKVVPVAQDVDVVVVGGTCGAVAAAEAAANAGARVYLVTPYGCLGEDIAGTLRCWADAGEAGSSKLMRAMFNDPSEKQGRRYTTPRQVKQALDTTLLQAGVTFLTGSYATDLLTDGQGHAAGIVMVNRSGRQALRAKVVIDATSQAALARAAGAEVTPFPPGEYAVTRTVISGDAPSRGGTFVEHVDWQPGKDTLHGRISGKLKPRLYECTFPVRFADGSPRAFAEAEQAARDRTFTKRQLDAADRLYVLPPNHIKASVSVAAPWRDAESFALEALRPAGTPCVFVLGALADVPRATAAELMKPASAILVGARLGVLAAEEATRRGTLRDVRLRGVPDTGRSVADVREAQGTLTRPYAQSAEFVVCEARELPVLAETDLVVVGGGTTGGPAAVGAVRKGTKTLLVEWLYKLGGVQTAGLTYGYFYGNRRGFTTEIDEGVAALDGTVQTQAKAEWYRSSVRQGGGEIWFGCMAVGAVLEGRALRGIVVATPDGQRGIVLARAVIDASGNADIAAAAGEPTEFCRAEELTGQGVGMAVVRLGSDDHNNNFSYLDDTDASDLCFFALRMRQMTDCGWDISQLVNSRGRRRLTGDFRVTALDWLTGRTYPDTITQHRSRFDLCGRAGGDFFLTKNIYSITNHAVLDANVPYRALLPQTTDGLLVVGLGMSAEREVMAVLRMQPDLQNQGYAAACAVSLALKANCRLRDIPVKELQRQLVAAGIVPEQVLTDSDSYPLPDAVLERAAHEVADRYTGLAFLLADPVRARPLLLAHYRENRNPETRLLYAHLLALLGDPVGEDDLLAWVSPHGWKDPWPARHDSGANRMGTYLLGLAKIKSRKAVPVICDKVMALKGFDPGPPDAYCRIAALVCQAIRDPAFADALAALLDAPGVCGHAMKMTAEIPPIPTYNPKSGWSDMRTDNVERVEALREINLATALIRIGDKNGKARALLTAYGNDPRGFFANYARRILAEQDQKHP